MYNVGLDFFPVLSYKFYEVILLSFGKLLCTPGVP